MTSNGSIYVKHIVRSELGCIRAPAPNSFNYVAVKFEKRIDVSVSRVRSRTRHTPNILRGQRGRARCTSRSLSLSRHFAIARASSLVSKLTPSPDQCHTTFVQHLDLTTQIASFQRNTPRRRNHIFLPEPDPLRPNSVSSGGGGGRCNDRGVRQRRGRGASDKPGNGSQRDASGL